MKKMMLLIVDPPDESLSHCIKYLVAMRMKHNKMVFNGTTIHHISVKKLLGIIALRNIIKS